MVSSIMNDESFKDVPVLSSLDAIRMRPSMYLRCPTAPLIDILGTFADSFLHLGMTEFTICEEPSFYIIKSKQDWLNQDNGNKLEFFFNGIFPIKGAFKADAIFIQAEVFLEAFYFQFFTMGDAGEYGNLDFLEESYGETIKENSKQYGRILIISKQQQLPKDHGINFEKPERTIAELENERKWLDLAIQQAKLNEKNS